MSILRHFNIANLQILLRALRREPPHEILRNLKRLLRSKPPKILVSHPSRDTPKALYDFFIKRESYIPLEGNMEQTLQDWTLPIPDGYQISAHAKAEIAWFLKVYPQLDIIYCDEDRLDAEGNRHNPVFKPAWSPERLLSNNYIGQPLAIRKELSHLLEENAWAFWQHTASQNLKVGHLPKVLMHKAPQTKTQPQTQPQPTKAAISMPMMSLLCMEK